MKPDREVTFNQSPSEDGMEIPTPVIPTVPKGVSQTTLLVDLPSRGLFYPKENPLSSGQVELRYMTAKDEDILTNQNYIMQGTAIERMFRNLLVSEIDWDDLLVGDKNAIMIAARIAAYGEDYVIQVTTPSGNTQDTTINLSELKPKPIDESVLVTKNSNLFKLTLPKSKKEVHVKLLTGKEDKEIDAIVKSYEKVGKDPGLLTLRLKHMIVARQYIYEEVFQLIHYGKGFTYNDLMDMPIFIRKFFYNRLLEAYEERNEANKKASKKSR